MFKYWITLFLILYCNSTVWKLWKKIKVEVIPTREYHVQVYIYILYAILSPNFHVYTGYIKYRCFSFK